LVQFSADSGATWSDVYAVTGDGPAWYPVRVDLPAASGTPRARVRFVATGGFAWWVDAVGFATDSTSVFQVLTVAAAVGVSEDPVPSDQVVVSWPCGWRRRKPSTRRCRGARPRAASGGARSRSCVRRTAGPTWC